MIALRTRKLAGVVIMAVLVVALGGVVAFASTRGGGSSAAGWQMMGGRYVYRPATSTPVRTLTAARSDAQQFSSRLGLRVDEVLQFERNFYAKLVDGHGNGATEVLVDPASGDVSIEYGPAMMWNTRYGMGAAGASMMGSDGAGMIGAYAGRSAPTHGYGERLPRLGLHRGGHKLELLLATATITGTEPAHRRTPDTRRHRDTVRR
jgi:hypothetical protein